MKVMEEAITLGFEDKSTLQTFGENLLSLGYGDAAQKYLVA